MSSDGDAHSLQEQPVIRGKPLFERRVAGMRVVGEADEGSLCLGRIRPIPRPAQIDLGPPREVVVAHGTKAFKYRGTGAASAGEFIFANYPSQGCDMPHRIS